MCFRIYLNGDYDVRDRFIAVFLVLERSDTDVELVWPFLRQVKLTLIDQAHTQDDCRDVVQTFISNPKSSSFQRPETNMNHGYGFKEFMPIEEFNRNQSRYVQDDALSIRVESHPIISSSGMHMRYAKANNMTFCLIALPAVDDIKMTPNDKNHLDYIGEDDQDIL